MSHYKPYPKYKDSGVEWIGDVPEGWEVKRLRHISEFKNSSVDKKTYEGQAAVGLCNYTDVYYNEFITKNLPFMQATASPAEIEQFSLQKGDVIITKDSEDPSDIGIPALVADDVLGVVCGYHLTQIRTGDLNTARLIHRTMQSHVTQAYFFVEAPGITRYGLGQDTIGSVTICLPPLNHRGSVANWIDRETARIDAIIAKKTRFIELLKEKRSALITHAVTKGINPNVKMKDSGVEWIGEVPEHWEVTPFKLHIERNDGGVWGNEPNGINDTPVLRSTEQTVDGNWSIGEPALRNLTANEKASSLLIEGDLLITKSSGSSLHIGKTTLVTKEIEQLGCCYSNFMQRIRLKASFKSRLTWFVMNNTITREQFDLASNSTTGLANLNGGMIGQLFVATPPTQEQSGIILFLDRETARIDLLTQKTQHSIDLLKERRSALITAAVTGQIDLRESA